MVMALRTPTFGGFVHHFPLEVIPVIGRVFEIATIKRLERVELLRGEVG